MLMAGAVPLPVRGTVCGLLAALSAMLIDAERGPSAAGVNVTDTDAELFGASVSGREIGVSEKSPAFVPMIDTAEMTRSAVPLLLNVTVCDADEVLSCWSPKFSAAGDKATAGAMPVPLTLIA